MPNPRFDEPTPEQRFQQIAAILAVGVIRRQLQLRRPPSAIDQKTSDSSPLGLEVSGRTRLCVSRRIGG